jgi:hypothetical protein
VNGAAVHTMKMRAPGGDPPVMANRPGRRNMDGAPARDVTTRAPACSIT